MSNVYRFLFVVFLVCSLPWFHGFQVRAQQERRCNKEVIIYLDCSGSMYANSSNENNCGNMKLMDCLPEGVSSFLASSEAPVEEGDRIVIKGFYETIYELERISSFTDSDRTHLASLPSRLDRNNDGKLNGNDFGTYFPGEKCTNHVAVLNDIMESMRNKDDSFGVQVFLIVTDGKYEKRVQNYCTSDQRGLTLISNQVIGAAKESEAIIHVIGLSVNDLGPLPFTSVRSDDLGRLAPLMEDALRGKIELSMPEEYMFVESTDWKSAEYTIPIAIRSISCYAETLRRLEAIGRGERVLSDPIEQINLHPQGEQLVELRISLAALHMLPGNHKDIRIRATTDQRISESPEELDFTLPEFVISIPPDQISYTKHLIHQSVLEFPATIVSFRKPKEPVELVATIGDKVSEDRAFISGNQEKTITVRFYGDFDSGSKILNFFQTKEGKVFRKPDIVYLGESNILHIGSSIRSAYIEELAIVVMIFIATLSLFYVSYLRIRYR